MEHSCLFWDRNYQKKVWWKLKRFFNTYKFSNDDINKFISLLWKGVYPYEYMDDWEKFITWKRRFYSHLNMEDITDADYANAKRVCKDFKIRHLGDYHDLCF